MIQGHSLVINKLAAGLKGPIGPQYKAKKTHDWGFGGQIAPKGLPVYPDNLNIHPQTQFYTRDTCSFYQRYSFVHGNTYQKGESTPVSDENEKNDGLFRGILHTFPKKEGYF